MGLRFVMFVIINVNLLNSGLYRSQIVPSLPNRRPASQYLIRTVVTGTHASCMDTCVYITDCLSVSYNRITKNCRMYNLSSTAVGTADLETDDHSVLINAADWPKFRTGECWKKPCPAKMKCTPAADTYTCQIEGGIGCKPYELPEHGTVIHDFNPINTTQSLYDVGTFLNVGCTGKYVTSTGDPIIYWMTQCRDSLDWSWTYQCHTAAEICTHEVLERFYPSRAQISVTSSVSGWSENETLIDSGSGWIAETNNDSQYVQVAFNEHYWIGGLKTKGGTLNNGSYSWVTSYNVTYSTSTDCSNYEIVLNQNGSQIFPANDDAATIVTNHFERQQNVKCLRVHPIGTSMGIVMRLGILACRDYP